jgi:hypothetical protein
VRLHGKEIAGAAVGFTLVKMSWLSSASPISCTVSCSISPPSGCLSSCAASDCPPSSSMSSSSMDGELQRSFRISSCQISSSIL